MSSPARRHRPRQRYLPLKRGNTGQSVQPGICKGSQANILALYLKRLVKTGQRRNAKRVRGNATQQKDASWWHWLPRQWCRPCRDQCRGSGLIQTKHSGAYNRFLQLPHAQIALFSGIGNAREHIEAELRLGIDGRGIASFCPSVKSTSDTITVVVPISTAKRGV